MKRIVTLIMCVWMLASCQESREEAMLRLVNEWNGKEIKFPSRSVFTIQGQDTVDFDFHHSDFKVVSYVDSSGCTSCKLQLHRWKELVGEVDSLTGGSVPFLFYLHPKDMKELRYLTRRDDFTYPVCFDGEDELNRLNRFPSDITFQTLLLDKENRVVAIGNPVLNPKVKELYLRLIKGNGENKSEKTFTQMSVDRTEQDFGTIPMLEKQERSFMLTNTGDKLLVVHQVVTSCGCTKVEYDKRPVRPGGTLELKVIYEADEPGRFRRSLRVYSNTENSPLRLIVRGMVE